MAEDITGPDRSPNQESQSSLKGSLAPGPSWVGPQAVAMDRAGVEPHISELPPGHTIQLTGSSVKAEFAPTIDLKDRISPPTLQLELGDLGLTVVQRANDYIEEVTAKRGSVGNRRVSDGTPAQSYSINVGDREIVVVFDTPDTHISAFTEHQVEKTEAQLNILYPYLESKEERELATKFGRLMQDVSHRTQEQASRYKSEGQAKAYARTMSLVLGRTRAAGGGNLAISPTLNDPYGASIPTVHLIELVRDGEGQRHAVDITEDGLSIPFPPRSELYTVSKDQHATMTFTGNNVVTIEDGNNGNASTNGTIVNRL